MTINITIEDTKNVASVLITRKGVTTSKKIQLNALSEAFQNLLTVEKDTGYISHNLIREVVKNTVCRAYYHKEFITDFKYTCRYTLTVKKNKYNIQVIDDNGRVTLLIPNFKYLNILGFISNSNTDAFNSSCYQVLSVVPNMFGEINDESKTVRFFPNQWDTNICWPSSFNKDVLNSRDISTQSTFVTQYLSSKFNTDLYDEKLRPNLVQKWIVELDEFFQEVLGTSSDSFYSTDRVGWFYLTYYFLSTIQNIDPAALVASRKLKTYFQNYL